MKGYNYNLCSLSKMLQSGWKMSGNAKAITMRKGSMVIIFDIIIPTKNGALYCACFKRTGGSNNDEIASGAIGKGTQMSIDKAHQLLDIVVRMPLGKLPNGWSGKLHVEL